MRHETALDAAVVVVVRPLVHAHLAALQVDPGRHTLAGRLALAILMDGDRGLVAVLHRPDDVLGAEGCVTAEKHARTRALVRHRIDLRDLPLVELDAEVALDPGEGVLLADREDHVVGWQELLGRDALGGDAATRIHLVLHDIEQHALELSALDHEGFGRAVDDDLDALGFGVFEFPLGRLEELPRLACHHLHALGAQAQRTAAAIHRGVADADDQHGLAHRFHMLERDRFEPGDADVDVGGAFLAAGQGQFFALRRAGSDEDGIEALFLEELAHGLDAMTEAQVHAHIDDGGDLLVDHRPGKAERGDVGAHQPTGDGELLEDRDLVAERHQIIGDGQRGAARADAGDLLAVLLGRDGRQPVAELVLVVGRDALQAADRDRFLLDAAAATSRLTGPVADPPEDAREDVRASVDEVRVGETPLGDQPDVLRHIGVGRTCPLAIHDFMEIVGMRSVRYSHQTPV